MKLNPLYIAIGAALLAQPAMADVQSLTSSELTETYIQDSTIIVTPAQRPAERRPSQVITYTIAPSEPVKTEAEEQGEIQQQQNLQVSSSDMAMESARQAAEEIEFMQRHQVAIAPLAERQVNIPELPGFRLPEGPFNEQMIGQKELGLASDGQSLTFSIGNIPGVDPIFTEQIRSDLVNLTPRADGGFDLNIQIPQR